MDADLQLLLGIAASWRFNGVILEQKHCCNQDGLLHRYRYFDYRKGIAVTCSVAI